MLLKCEKISKSYTLGKVDIHVLKDVDFEIQRGAFDVISGPSGSGKTTLLNLCGLIDVLNSGTIIFNGQNVEHMSDKNLTSLRCKKIGYIFQNFYLIPVLSVYENVEFPLQLLGLSYKERKSRVEKYLERVGLWERQKHKPDHLSGGEQQRLAVARALVKIPDIIIADEPTANLDSTNTHKIIQLMKNLSGEEGITFLIASHDPIVISAGRRNIKLHDGKIQEIEERVS